MYRIAKVSVVSQSPSKPAKLPAMDEPGIYRLRVVGRLGAAWQERFEGLHITERECSDPRGISEVTVPIADQAALLSLLGQLSDAQCTLLSVALAGDE